MNLVMAARLLPGSFLACLLAALLLPAGAAADTILVVPFENVNGAAELDWVSESFSEGLTGRLLGHGHGLVARDERLAALERLGLPEAAPLTRASLLRLGEEVGADWVVLGRFAVKAESLQAGLQLLDLHGPRLMPWVQRNGPFARLLDAQGVLAWAVLKRVDPAFPLSREEFQRQHPQLQVSAFESYVRGLLAMSEEQQRHYFLQAYRLQPDYSPAAYRLAMLDFEQQDYAAAAGWLAKIPGSDPLSAEAGFYLSLCFYFQDDAARAAATLTPVAHRFPVSSVWNNLGVFTSRQGQARSAVDYFSRALVEDPGDPDACFNLGLHHLRSGDWQSGVGTLGRCTVLNPGDTGALLLYARALDHLGRSEEARAAREQAGEGEAANGPDIASNELDRLHQRLSAPHAGAGVPEASHARARHVQVHLQRGRDHLARGDLEQARQQFMEVILLDPASHQAHLYLAEIYRREGRTGEAIAELKASVWSMDTAEARLSLAEIYLTLDQPEEAGRQVQFALRLDPENVTARDLAARLPLQMADTPAEEGSME
jgi:tetratricopeptide (TPR) repeat protein/TolB-like protein